MLIQIAIAIFLLLELSNVIALYFSPANQRANAMGAFLLWEESQSDPQTHLLLKYMANWVAGSKLIFILLLVVILLFGDPQIQFFSLGALILAIGTYYWRLMPLMQEMDKQGMIQPRGYSRTLTKIITIFVLVLSSAGVIDLIR